MKGLLNKEHYCYKIYILMESRAPPYIDNPLGYMDYSPQFHKKILIPPSVIFQKSQPPINKKGFTL